MTKVQWCSPPPEKCDTCDTRINQNVGGVFYDMKTTTGPWGCLCPSCAMLGPGIGRVGLGLGQKYEKQPDGTWLKTEG